MLPRATWLALTFVIATGCNTTLPELAPDEVDHNVRWFWVHGDSADEATLLDGAAKLAVAGKADTRTAPLKGQMRERLTAEEVAVVGLTGVDPAAARGLLVVNLFDCTLDKLEGILIALDQKAQYQGVYDAYDRRYTSDADAFLARTTPKLSWDVDVKASLPIGDTYTSKLKGGVRRVKGPADGPTKGDVLITRTWLTEPATFLTNSGSWFRQDYQVEIYWEHAPGRIFHAYGMWRDIMAAGVGLGIEDNGFFNIVLDNLVKWDDETAKLCAKP